MPAYQIFKKWLSVILIASSVPAHSAVIWVGGEDLDFSGTLCTTTASWCYRSGYARQALKACNSWTGITSSTFPAQTSAWFSVRVRNPSCAAGNLHFGMIKAGTNNGLWVGTDSTSNWRVALYTYDGTTQVKLASEAGTTLIGDNLHKIDVQVTNYNGGASGNAKVYIDGGTTPVINYTGNLAVGGNTSLNAINLSNNNCEWWWSEVLVADSDTRSYSVVTHVPNAAGTTNTWTSAAFGNINPVTINDAVFAYDSVAGDVFQYKMSALPSTNTGVAAVKVSLRGVNTSTGPQAISIGVNHGGTAFYPAAQTMNTGWSLYEQIFQTNPVTSAAWTPSDVNNLQMSLKSAP